MEYKQTLDTPSYLCDDADRLHVWAAVRLCQEVTEYHGTATGIGFRVLLERDRAWVISRALYNFYRRPEAFEPITLETWARGNDGLFAFRDYHAADASGRTFLTGTSYWPLIEMSTRRAVRLGSVVEGYEMIDRHATERDRLNKIVLPPLAEADVLARRTVSHSMLDHTRHVNNSEYIRLIFDCLQPLGFSIDEPFSLELNYNHETRLGEELVVRGTALAAASGSEGNPQPTSIGPDSREVLMAVSNPRGLSVSAKITRL